MKSRIPAPLLFAMAVSLVPLLGCNRDRGEENVDTTPAVESTVQPVRVTQLQLGRAIGADNRVTASVTEFTAMDTIYASVVTEGTAPSATLTARWTFEDDQLVEESSQTLAPSGTAVTEFHIFKSDGWPVGRYRVDILLNGASVQSMEFDVK